jgi:hypothetical protein
MDLPQDPRSWDSSEVEAFARGASADEIQSVVFSLADPGDPPALGVLSQLLRVRGDTTYDKALPGVLAARALLQAGPAGVRILSEALIQGPRPPYASGLLMTLWRASRNDFQPSFRLKLVGLGVTEIDPPRGTAEAAHAALSDYVAEAIVNPNHFSDIGGWMMEISMADDGADDRAAAADIGSLFAEASIRLSRSLLEEYARLIEGQQPEETYQRFLADNPALLDPLAAEVLPKLRLGSEYATDFALRRHDNRWLLVEIEKPHDRIFTAQDDFSAVFTHAYGQVLDFQRWVDDHVEYARAAMSDVVVPRGLLVIGMRRDLNARQENKLSQLVSNSARIDVVTFDDLLHQATVVYGNLHKRPEAADGIERPGDDS